MKGFIKKLLSKKQGLAIELALLVLLVIVSLSALLVSVGILSKNTTDSLAQSINERLLHVKYNVDLSPNHRTFYVQNRKYAAY